MPKASKACTHLLSAGKIVPFIQKNYVHSIPKVNAISNASFEKTTIIDLGIPENEPQGYS